MAIQDPAKVKQLTSKLAELAKHLHGCKMLEGGGLRLVVGYGFIDFFHECGYTQRYIGSIIVSHYITENQPKIFDGMFYRYDMPFQTEPTCISFSGSSAQEVIEKMSNCLAPLLNLDPWNTW